MKTIKTRAVILAITVVAALVASACEQRGVSLGNGWRQGVVTFDGDSSHTYRALPGGIEVTAPRTNKGGSLRVALVREADPYGIDQEACATWHGPIAGSIVQPGLVLRAQTDDFRTRLIMVTNNVMYGIRSTINVHLVDTDGGDPPYTLHAQGHSPHIGDWSGRHPLPWRFCARVVGQTLEAKAWSTQLPEPRWEDSSSVIRTTVPPDFIYGGQPGGYIGHVRPGETTRLTNVTTRRITGTPGDQRWQQAQETVQRASRAVHGTSTPNDRLAAAVSRGDHQSATVEIAMSPEGRYVEGRAVFERMLGRPGGAALQGSAVERAQVLARSAEFRNGASTDAQWIRRLYQRVLGRTPTAGQVNSWVQRLRQGTSRNSVVQHFWLTAEHGRKAGTEAFTAVFGRTPTAREADTAEAIFRTAAGGDRALTRALLIATYAGTF